MLSRVPYPLIKGDKLRAYYHIMELSKYHEIILFALSDTKVEDIAIKELKKYCSRIYIFRLRWHKIIWGIIKAFFFGKPLQIGYFYDSSIKKQVNKIVSEQCVEHIYCQLIRVSEYVKHFNIPKTLDYQDVFSKGVERRIKTAPILLRLVLKLEYKRLLKYEREIFDYFTNKTIISKPDRDLIQHKNNEEIHVVPNGVDYNIFRPIEAEKKFDLIFTGNMSYPPNINAVCYLVSEIMPLLIKHNPTVKLLIAGAHPVKKIKDFQSENVIITGWVEDIRMCYAESKIFIAPMQIGTGLQNKLLEAMAMQLPCISSSLANAALGAEERKEILIGETPEAYAAHVITLLTDSSYAKKMALEGFSFVKTHYSWENNVGIVRSIIENNYREYSFTAQK